MRKSSGGSGSGSLVDAFRVGRTRKFARENEAQQTAKRKQDEALVIEVDEEDTQAAPPLSPPVHLHKVREVFCSPVLSGACFVQQVQALTASPSVFSLYSMTAKE